MKRLALLLAVAVFTVVACGEDDDAVGGETAESSATSTDTAEAPDDGTPDESASGTPVEIPDDPIDWTGRAEVEVSVQDNVFEQREIIVSPGTAVTWTNEGVQPHNVKPSEDGAFEPIGTGELDPGVSQTRVFDEAGDYPYFCSLHGTATRGQTGRVIVVEA